MSQYLLDALKAIKKDPPEKNYGICANVGWLVFDATAPIIGSDLRQAHREEADRVMCRLLARWPDAAGLDANYPVEGLRYEYMVSQRDGTVWQNPRRIALLDWMIKELENERQ